MGPPLLLYVFQLLPHYALWNTVCCSFVSLTLSTKFHLCNSVYSLCSCRIYCEPYPILSMSQYPHLNSTHCLWLTYHFIQILQNIYLHNGGYWYIFVCNYKTLYPCILANVSCLFKPMCSPVSILDNYIYLLPHCSTHSFFISQLL
jgi:hypothetical protein